MIEKVLPESVPEIISREESHFFDVKAVEIAPASLSKTISAFANSSGGELLIGVDEQREKCRKNRQWRGFIDQEAANPIVSVVEEMGGPSLCSFTPLRSEGFNGYLLHIVVRKSQGIVRATNGIPYVRRNAQTLKFDTPEKVKRLELEKGIASFEDETISTDLVAVTNSITVLDFMLAQLPNAEPETWLRSQFLVTQTTPTVAAVLLFADEPQALLPKRSAIKIFRYKTADQGIDRDQLAFDPLTIEGPIVDLIYEAVAETKRIVEGIKKITPEGLEAVSYPDETLHEIITNAVLHRDYSIATDIQVRIYDDRVEVHSPGRLAGHVTIDNVLDEQFARNGKLVRIANKFPNAPNKDVGEGLNTAFEAMRRIRLREPELIETENFVVVNVRHKRLASPMQIIMEYLETNDEITNKIGRDITGLKRDVQVKDQFVALRKNGLLEQVPGKRGRASAWRKRQ